MKKLRDKQDIRIIIAGSRDVNAKSVSYQNAVVTCIQELLDLREADEEDIVLVSGKARGADQLVYPILEENDDMFLSEFPADWDTHGKSAGYIRNEEMAEYADHLILVWDFESRGSRHMFDIAVRHKMYPILIVPYNADEKDIAHFEKYVVKYKPNDIRILKPIKEN